MDKDLPTEYHYKLVYLYIFQWTFDWTNIKYNVPTLDMKDVKLSFTRGYETALVKLDFPAIKSWEIDAHQTVTSLFFPSESDVQLVF